MKLEGNDAVFDRNDIDVTTIRNEIRANVLVLLRKKEFGFWDLSGSSSLYMEDEIWETPIVGAIYAIALLCLLDDFFLFLFVVVINRTENNYPLLCEIETNRLIYVLHH